MNYFVLLPLSYFLIMISIGVGFERCYSEGTEYFWMWFASWSRKDYGLSAADYVVCSRYSVEIGDML